MVTFVSMSINNAKLFYPENAKQWRSWLEENHEKEQSVWLVSYKKSSEKPSVTWSESVDEALCFGWIDSVKKKLDEEGSIQFFCKRKAKSTWSKINKEKIERLAAEGLMHPAGWASVEIAKENGSWNILDSVEDLIIPPDLEQALLAEVDAMAYFLSLSKSSKKGMLQWLVMAKREETRLNRINEIVYHAGLQQKPKQF